MENTDSTHEGQPQLARYAIIPFETWMAAHGVVVMLNVSIEDYISDGPVPLPIKKLDSLPWNICGADKSWPIIVKYGSKRHTLMSSAIDLAKHYMTSYAVFDDIRADYTHLLHEFTCWSDKLNVDREGLVTNAKMFPFAQHLVSPGIDYESLKNWAMKTEPEETHNKLAALQYVCEVLNKKHEPATPRGNGGTESIRALELQARLKKLLDEHAKTSDWVHNFAGDGIDMMVERITQGRGRKGDVGVLERRFGQALNVCNITDKHAKSPQKSHEPADQGDEWVDLTDRLQEKTTTADEADGVSLMAHTSNTSSGNMTELTTTDIEDSVLRYTPKSSDAQSPEPKQLNFRENREELEKLRLLCCKIDQSMEAKVAAHLALRSFIRQSREREL